MRDRKTHLYYETINWSTYWAHFFRSDKTRFLQALREDMGTNDSFLLSSGRAAIYLSLSAAGIGRNSEVFVPPFMSACVLDAVNRGGCPSLTFSEKTRAVLLYHHWGYPQDFPEIRKKLLGKDVLVIEDCAHGFWGKSHGIRVGEFGDTALFSLSKIFESTYAGALRVNKTELLASVRERLARVVSLQERWASLRGEWTYLDFYNRPLEERDSADAQASLGRWYATLLAYPICKSIRGRLPQNKSELNAVFQRQNRHFLCLLENLRDSRMMLPADAPEEMAPLCFPFMHDDTALLKDVIRWLKERRIFVDIYHFDVSRNMFAPRYVKCVPVPLYASLDDSLFEDFATRFRGAA